MSWITFASELTFWEFNKVGHLLLCLRLAGGIILGLTYGYEVQDGEDPFVNLIEGANANFNAATVPGAFPVDFFPVMKSLPDWLPGMGFLKTAMEWAKDTAAMVEVPYSWTQRQMVCAP